MEHNVIDEVTKATNPTVKFDIMMRKQIRAYHGPTLVGRPEVRPGRAGRPIKWQRGP